MIPLKFIKLQKNETLTFNSPFIQIFKRFKHANDAGRALGGDIAFLQNVQHICFFAIHVFTTPFESFLNKKISQA